MRAYPFPLRALLLSSGLLFGACVIAIDDTGASFHGLSHFSDSGHQVRGSGVTATRAVDIAPFQRFISDGSWEVELDVVPGAAPSLTVEGDDNIIDHIEFEEYDGTLRVSLKPGSYKFKRQLIVRATTDQLNGFGLDGSGEAVIRGIDSEMFKGHISGSGDLELEGNANNLTLQVSGSGEIDAFRMHAKNVKISVAGSGEIHVNALENLDVSISGSGTVIYRGDPQKNISIAGSGEVYRD